MRSLDDVLEGKEPEVVADPLTDGVVVNHTEADPETGTPADPKGETAAVTPPADGAPPAPENEDEDERLPAHVVKKIRGERNDWKEKALIAQAKLEERERVEKQRQQPQGQYDQQPMTQEQAFATQIFNERLNNSEMVLRSKHEDVDEKIAVFMEAAQQNPALAAELQNQTHPYQWAYSWAQKEMARREIGDDPVAYRKRLEDEIRASISAPHEPAAAATPRAPLPPASLATARSAAPRSAEAWTGPTPLESIIKR